MVIDKKYIYAYALKNAIEHEGRAVSGSVISGLFNHGLTKDKIKDVINDVNQIINEVNSWNIDKQKIEFENYKDLIGHRQERAGLPELEKVPVDGVVMRYRPGPSGPMHIGHIISNMAQSLYVNKYGGKFYVIIDDSDPKTSLKESYKNIKIDCDWIFGNVFKYINTSDNIKRCYFYIEKLLENGNSYVCTCDSEKFKKLVDNKKPCPCRKNTIEENKKRWSKMLDKTGYKEGEAVLRFKSDLNNPNPALRDFPLARICLTSHPLQKTKYRVWPLMNLAVTVDDIEYKMTHIIRGKDHKDNSLRQKMIYEALGIKDFPITLFIGRMKFTDIILSKRKIKSAIEEGSYEGWDDIRLPTIASLRKRGYQKEAFEQFAIQRGISEVDKVISQKDLFDVINNLNREILKDKTGKASFDKTNEKDSNMIAVMPDNKKVFGKTDVKAKSEEILYFSKFGYAKFNGLEGRPAKQVFWFCHE
ncbi:MAG: glutamate--tRNA ligase family protein [Nanoarchaeota archaeon]|nr:glutamate--tRNA ligase family protein [Nanoarchaeota archaeon]